jgi:hypothetical protein
MELRQCVGLRPAHFFRTHPDGQLKTQHAAGLQYPDEFREVGSDHVGWVVLQDIGGEDEIEVLVFEDGDIGLPIDTIPTSVAMPVVSPGLFDHAVGDIHAVTDLELLSQCLGDPPDATSEIEGDAPFKSEIEPPHRLEFVLQVRSPGLKEHGDILCEGFTRRVEPCGIDLSQIVPILLDPIQFVHGSPRCTTSPHITSPTFSPAPRLDGGPSVGSHGGVKGAVTLTIAPASPDFWLSSGCRYGVRGVPERTNRSAHPGHPFTR